MPKRSNCVCLTVPGSEELERYVITENDNNIWHIYLAGVKPEQVYGYRVYGPYKPEAGLRFNHHKLLIDPYGKKLIGKLIWNKAIFGYDIDSPDKDLSFSALDSAPYVPKSVVVDDAYDWGDDRHPRHKFEESIIYETHRVAIPNFILMFPRPNAEPLPALTTKRNQLRQMAGGYRRRISAGARLFRKPSQKRLYYRQLLGL